MAIKDKAGGAKRGVGAHGGVGGDDARAGVRVGVGGGGGGGSGVGGGGDGDSSPKSDVAKAEAARRLKEEI
eukprot:6112011-Pleurochrysis_carterae.AAC.1